MYLIRKLSNTPNLYKLRHCKDIGLLDADILRQELRTEENNLSCWKCEQIDDSKQLKDTLKAIILSTSSIKVSQFVIFDMETIQKFGFSMDFLEEGKTAYMGYENLHINLTQLTYSKLGDVLSAYCMVTQNENFTPLLKKDEVTDYIIEAFNEGLIDKEKLHKDLLSDMSKFLPI